MVVGGCKALLHSCACLHLSDHVRGHFLETMLLCLCERLVSRDVLASKIVADAPERCHDLLHG